MSDPTRLVDDVESDATARELLRAGRQQRLSAHDKDQIWMGLAAQLPATIVPGSATAKAAAGAAKAAGAKALGTSAALKGTLFVIALGGGALGGAYVLRPHAAPAPNPAPVVAPPLAPARPAPPLEPHAPARPRRVALAPVEAPAPRRPAPSALAAEGRVVLEARALLRDGRAEDALRVLEVARTAFADGALVQEREALAIEALAKTGRRADASRRAVAFLRAHPESPHAAAVRAFATP